MDIVGFMLIVITISVFVKFRSAMSGFLKPVVFLLRNTFRSGSQQKTLLAYVRKHAKQGNPVNILQIIDKFLREEMWSWQLGEKKGKFLDAAVADANPKYALELGSYCGYSALRIARLLAKESKLVTIECDPTSAQTARDILSFAGLSEKVRVITGSSSDVISTIREDYGIDSFDLVFIDHAKSLYTTDLKKLEEKGLVKVGSVIVADNMGVPGNPEYAEYIQQSDRYKTEVFTSVIDGTGIKDDIWKSVKTT